MFCPKLLVRQVRPIGGQPNIRVRVDPAADYGCTKRQHALGAGHISYAGDQALRLTTNAPAEAIVDRTLFHVHQTITLMFGLDNPVAGAGDVTSTGTTMLERTTAYWRHWTRSLQAPTEWRDAVIRAAITLELNVYEPTGAIIASMTTSIPEAPNTGRTWDYRYCWPRDAYFTADALCRLGDTRTIERYLAFLLGVAARRLTTRVSSRSTRSTAARSRTSTSPSVCPAIGAWDRYTSATRRASRPSTISTAKPYSRPRQCS